MDKKIAIEKIKLLDKLIKRFKGMGFTHSEDGVIFQAISVATLVTGIEEEIEFIRKSIRK